MTPTPRAAYALAVVALSALVLPIPLVIVAALALATATALDAWSVRRAPDLAREHAAVLSRGVPSPLELRPQPHPGRLRLRQPAPPDLEVEPREGSERLAATIVPRRRGRHELPRAAGRSEGPLGLGAWHHRLGEEAEVLVYPDLPSARRLALAVRQGRFRDVGRLTRGPLGLGTDFELVRDYLPDDDVRQVNWRATARLARPMSNQYRIEQDRDVMCVVDAGRLMGAPLGDRTRLDSALDAVAAVGLVADVLGDRCGAVAFDAKVRRLLSPRRGGGDAVVRQLFDLEPTAEDSDYELAFRTVEGAKRSLVLVLTDILDEAAARPLVEAMPVLARRHVVVVASASDDDLDAALSRAPASELDVYAAAAALDVLGARARVSAALARGGVEVLEADAGELAAACVRAYLKAKSRARL